MNCNFIKLKCQGFIILKIYKFRNAMKNKLVKSVGINEERARRLQQKAVELMIKEKVLIKESEVVAFLIDEALELVDIDHHGLFINTDLEEK